MMSSARATGAIVPTDREVKAGRLELKYSCASDKYLRAFDNNSVVHGWRSLVHEATSVFKKEEHDWKMVYLACQEGRNFGKVVWYFDVGAQNMCVDRVEILVESTCFHSGRVNWTLCGTVDERKGEVKVTVAPGSQDVYNAFSGCTELRLSAELSGGHGEGAWQHAQLFRQSRAALREFPLKITVNLRPGEQRS